MSGYHVKYLLIGGGLAASSAAAAIRTLDRDGQIVLIAQEIVRPYHRPPLSKEYLRRQTPREALFVHDRDWFERNHVELRTGRRAAHLDATRGAVALDNGEVIAYDRLLLATGMSPRPLDAPGADLPNLFYLRTLEDAHTLQKAIDKAKAEGRPHDPSAPRTSPRGKVAVIGAGSLGVELAASFAQMGLSVDLLCARSHPWDKFAGEIAGKTVSSYLASRGVRVHVDARPARLEGDGRVQRVIVDEDRSIDCDFAVAAVGGVAHRELLRGTPLEAEKAILTDSRCRTNVAHIYAAGDCAAILDPLFGKHRVLDHWASAVATGTLAGRNMAGADESYAVVNTFDSQLFDLTLRAWGEPKQVDHRLVRTIRPANGAPPDLIEIGVAADGRVAQVLALGHAGDDDVLREMVARRVNVAGREEQLKDPVVSLEAALR